MLTVLKKISHKHKKIANSPIKVRFDHFSFYHIPKTHPRKFAVIGPGNLS